MLKTQAKRKKNYQYQKIMENARTCPHVDGQTEYSRCQGYTLHLFFNLFFILGVKMAKSFIDVVQDFPRTGLGIAVKNKKPPLSNQYTACGTGFWL